MPARPALLMALLLVLGRQQEAFAAAQRGLALAPSFGPLQDIKALPAFRKWQSAAREL